MKCKFRIKKDGFLIEEAHVYNMSSADKKEVVEIIYNNYPFIIEAWHKHFNQ